MKGVTNVTVLAFVQRRPGSTVREIAVGLTGVGSTRTRQRSAVHNALLSLERSGKLRRQRPDGPYDRGNADTWYPSEPGKEGGLG